MTEFVTVHGSEGVRPPASGSTGANARSIDPGAPTPSPEGVTIGSASVAPEALYSRVLADKAPLGAIRSEVSKGNKAGGEAFPEARYGDAAGVTAADVRKHSAESFVKAAAHHEKLVAHFTGERGAAEAELAQLRTLDAADGSHAAEIKALAAKHGVPLDAKDLAAVKSATEERLGSLEGLAGANAARASASAKAFTAYAGLRRSWLGAALRRVPFQAGLGTLNTVMLIASLPSLVQVAASVIPKHHDGSKDAGANPDADASSGPHSVQARSLIRAQARQDAAAAQGPAYGDAAPSPYGTPYGVPYGDPYAGRGIGA